MSIWKTCLPLHLSLPGMNPQERGPLHAWHMFSWPGRMWLPGGRWLNSWSQDVLFPALKLWLLKRGHKNMDIKLVLCADTGLRLYTSAEQFWRGWEQGQVTGIVSSAQCWTPTKCLANSSFFVTVSVTSERLGARRRGKRRQL